MTFTFDTIEDGFSCGEIFPWIQYFSFCKQWKCVLQMLLQRVTKALNAGKMTGWGKTQHLDLLYWCNEPSHGRRGWLSVGTEVIPKCLKCTLIVLCYLTELLCVALRAGISSWAVGWFVQRFWGQTCPRWDIPKHPQQLWSHQELRLPEMRALNNVNPAICDI